MANTTIVDQLIVTLGLDPTDFTQGQREVAAGIVRTRDEVRSASRSMAQEMQKTANSFAGSGGTIARVFSKGGAVGLAIAATIATGKILNDTLYEVAENTRRIDLESKKFDSSAKGLRNVQNVAELAGGSINDATQSVGGLTQSLYNLRFNGQVSESLVMLGRLGVQFQDATGRARDFKSVALDTAAALERLQQQGTMTRGEAIYAAEQAGFHGGLAQLVAQGRAVTDLEFAKQENRRQVTTEDTEAAAEWIRSSQSKGQAGEAEMGVPLMRRDAAVNAAMNRGIERMITLTPVAMDALGDAAMNAASAVGDLAVAATNASIRAGKSVGRTFSSRQKVSAALYSPLFAIAAQKYGVRADVLSGIARTESGYDYNAEAKNAQGEVTGRGIMQLNPKYFKNAGASVGGDINMAAAHLRKLLDSFEGTEQEKYIHALRAYHAGETNYREGTNIGPVNRAYAGKVLQGTSLAIPSESAGDSNTNVNIGKIEVRTQATDAEGIMRDAAGAARRKFIAAQSDTGMN